MKLTCTIGMMRGMLLVLLFSAMLSSCDFGNTGDTAKNNYAVPGDNTLVITEAEAAQQIQAVNQTDVVSHAYDVELTPGSKLAEDLDNGDILIVGITPNTPTGFMQRVVSEDTVDGKKVLHTQPAALAQALTDCNFSCDLTLSPEQIATSKALDSGCVFNYERSVASRGSRGLSLSYDITTDLGDGVTITGSLGVEVNPSFAVSIQNGDLKSISFSASATQSSSITLSASHQWSFSKEKELYSHTFSPITITIPAGIIPIPIVIVPVLTIRAGVSGTITAGISSSVSEQASIGGTIAYSGDSKSWSFVPTSSASFNVVPFEAELNATAKVYAGPILDLYLYGIAGPYLNVDGFFNLDIDPFSMPIIELTGGLEGAIGISIEPITDVLNTVLSEDEQIEGRKSYSFPIKSWVIFQWPNATPVPTINPTPGPTVRSLPDLICSSIDMPNGISIGDNCTFTATIANIGVEATGGVYVEWYVDGALKMRTLIGLPFLSGYSQQTTITWTATPSLHTVRVVVDPDNYITESNDDNNTKEVELIVSDIPHPSTPEPGTPAPRLPDLECPEITVPSGMVPGNSYTLTAAVYNIGLEYTGGVKVMWYIDGSPAASYLISTAIAPGSSQNASLSYTGTPGNHTVKLVIDPDNTIVESNESNNICEGLAFFVNDGTTPTAVPTTTPPPVTCSISCSGISGPSAVYMTRSYSYSVPVNNPGSSTCGATVELLVDGSSVSSTSVTLAAYSSGTASLTWTANVGRGNHTLEVRIGSNTCATMSIFADVDPGTAIPTAVPTAVPTATPTAAPTAPPATCNISCSGISGQSSVYMTSTYSYSVPVANSGNSTCGATVELLVDGSAVTSASVTLAAYSSGTASLTWTANVGRGNHTLEVRIGSSTCASMSIFADVPPTSIPTAVPTAVPTATPTVAPTAPPATASFTCSGISGSSSVNIGATNSYSTTVSNTGNGSGSVTVTWSVDGSAKSSSTFTLAAGGSSSRSFSWTANASHGNHTMTVSVGSGNCGSISIYVN